MKRSVGAFELLRLFDQLDDARYRVVGGSGRDPHAKDAVAVDSASKHLGIDAFAYRRTFSSNRSFIDGTFAGDNDSVSGNPVAGPHHNHIADIQRIRRHLSYLTAIVQKSVFRHERCQRLNAGAGFVRCNALE